VYLHASNNNRAETVLALFKEAVERFGIPSRVRCDQGGENYDVAGFMLSSRAVGRGSVIAGIVNILSLKTVHFQEILSDYILYVY